MPTAGDKFNALLATGRVANLPTVWSNVLVAYWFATQIKGIDLSVFGYTSNLDFWLILFTLCATSCL